MQDAVQQAEFLGIAKDDLGKLLAIYITPRREQIRSEVILDLLFCPRIIQKRVGNLVRIDDGATESGKFSRDGALAGSDAADIDQLARCSTRKRSLAGVNDDNGSIHLLEYVTHRLSQGGRGGPDQQGSGKHG